VTPFEKFSEEVSSLAELVRYIDSAKLTREDLWRACKARQEEEMEQACRRR
jgi:hypothetical protein